MSGISQSARVELSSAVGGGRQLHKRMRHVRPCDSCLGRRLPTAAGVRLRYAIVKLRR